MSGDPPLSRAVETGHKWWILSESISNDECLAVSEYRNADQNTSQVHGDTKLECHRARVHYELSHVRLQCENLATTTSVEYECSELLLCRSDRAATRYTHILAEVGIEKSPPCSAIR